MNLRVCFLFFCLLASAPARAAGLDPSKGKPPYRISGIAVSSRDGAPIPFCRLRLTAAVDGNVTFDDASRFDVPLPPDARFESIRAQRSNASPVDENAVSADAHGHFSIDVPKPGAWRLTGTARGFRQQAYDAHERYFSAIVLTDAAPALAVTLRLAPDAIVAGFVLDEAGEPVAAAQVQAEDANPDPARAPPRDFGRGFGLTDDRGHYEIAGLAPGRYRVRVDARPWYASGAGSRLPTFSDAKAAPATPSPDPSLDVVYPTTWFPGTDDPQAADTLTLSGGEDRQVDFHLVARLAARLSLPRTGAPNPQGERQGWPGQVVVRVSDRGFPAPTGNMSATEDAWEVGGLAPGTYEVRMPGTTDDVRRFTVRAGGSVDLSSAVSLVRVALRFDGDAGRRPQVTLIDTASGARFASASGRGSFGAFGGRPGRGRDGGGIAVSVPPGSYRVSAWTGEDSYLTGVTAEGAKASGGVVQVTGGSPTLTLKMASGRAHLSGVARRGETPAAGALVLLVPASGEVGALANRIVETETNSDGSFHLGGTEPGPYILVVLDGGWNVNWHDPGTLAGYLEHGLPLDLKPAATKTVEVTALRP